MTPSPPDWALVKRLFDQALELPAAQRTAFIDKAGHGDAVGAELRSLLAHHEAATVGQVFMVESAAQALTQAGAVLPGQRLGAWEVVRAIGAGGMGEVFEARRADGQYQGQAAVKLLKRGMDSAAVLQRFALERQALARLSHPHIARLLDAGAGPDGLPYFVLEYVAGQPIDQAARTRPLDERLQLFLQLADAVAHAHRNLLVHRDLKPGNVLVDADGQVKLLDFGIAKALDPLEAPAGTGGAADTLAGPRPYTPNYASPEQVRGEPVTTATDIYSLGVLLYEMLTGTRPTGRRATTPGEAARSVLEDAPTRPSRLSASDAVDPHWLATRRRLEGDLDNILLKALEKAPERRYASVDALAADVRAFLAGRPVSARAPSARYLAAKFVRRNRLPVGLAASALLALLAGLAGTSWQWRQAEAARVAEAQRAGQVRAQANRLLFDYHDQILLLPGSTSVARRLLEDARGYLDSLAASAAGDRRASPALLRELGVAQRRLGELYASPGRAALGDTQASEALLRQALVQLERAYTLAPQDSESLYQWALAEAALASGLRDQGQGLAALPLYDSASRHFDTLAQARPDQASYRVEQVRSRLRMVDLYGSTQGGLGRAAEADAALAAAGVLLGPLRADFPQDLDVAALYASTENLRYLSAARDGRWADGLAILLALQPVFAQLVAQSPDNTLVARDAAVNELSRGVALGQLGRYAEARDASRDGLARMNRLVAADPANRNARRDAAKLQTDVGWASLKLGDTANATTDLQAAVDALSALASADPADRRVAALLVTARSLLAETLAAAPARRAEARQLITTALSTAAELARNAPSDVGALRGLAIAHQTAAQVARVLAGPGPSTAASHAGQPAGRAAHSPADTPVCNHLRDALAAWVRLQDSGRLRRADQPRLDAARAQATACTTDRPAGRRAG